MSNYYLGVEIQSCDLTKKTYFFLLSHLFRFALCATGEKKKFQVSYIWNSLHVTTFWSEKNGNLEN